MKSPIQTHYEIWQRQTSTYLAFESEWKARKIGSGEFEDKTDPILKERDVVEVAIFAMRCECLEDLKSMIFIAAYFNWTIDDFNTAIAREAGGLKQAEAVAKEPCPPKAVPE